MEFLDEQFMLFVPYPAACLCLVLLMCYSTRGQCAIFVRPGYATGGSA